MAPKWVTPTRKAQLVKLWAQYGNRCLKGHRVCPDRSHYVQPITALQEAWVPDRMAPAQRPDGTPIRDSHGNPISYMRYKQVSGTVKVAETTLRLYEQVEEEVIRHWVSDDASRRTAEWKADQARLHRAPDQHFHQGEFDNIRREKFLAEQPPYYIEALTPNALTFRPVALVRIPSTGVHLFVELGEALQRVSKSARRKAIRYGKPLPQDTAAAAKLIQSAVQDWWAKRK